MPRPDQAAFAPQDQGVQPCGRDPATGSYPGGNGIERPEVGLGTPLRRSANGDSLCFWSAPAPPRLPSRTIAFPSHHAFAVRGDPRERLIHVLGIGIVRRTME